MSSQQTRRVFLKTASLLTAAVAAPMVVPRSAFAQGNVPGANDRLSIAGIGVGRQGSEAFRWAMNDPRTQGVCVCDVWKKRAEDIAKKHELKDAYQDYRKVIERKDVDAIVTATPEHWRSIICVNAALAGKHLYIEKPVTLTIEDGKLMRAAARKTGVKVQCGSMQRSDRINDLACRFIREGHLGKITEIHTANYETPWLYNMSAETVYDGLDWDMWCGPTEPVPFNKELFVPRGKPGWLSFRPYSGGEMTGWGTHGFDQVQCALGLDRSGPVDVIVEGEKLIPPVFEKPTEKSVGDVLCNTPSLAFKYEGGPLVRLNWDVPWNSGKRGGAIFFGEKGKVEIARGSMTSDPKGLAEEWLKANEQYKMRGHTANWIDCIYSGAKPIGELETGIRTASICHILNIARYLGRSLKWDPKNEVFIGDDEANTWLSREHRKGYEQPKV